MAILSRPQADPIWVISPYYCAPYHVDLGIVKKIFTISDGNFVVNTNGNIIFKVKGVFSLVHKRRIIVDAIGNPIKMTAHRRWKAYRGDSTDSKDLLFGAKTKLDVFLAHNTKEKVCDFKVEGSRFKKSYVIYAGDTSMVIARMRKKQTAESILIRKDYFMVTVYPDIDYAFIVALIVILDEINHPKHVDSGAG
ncbi:hypothetical protein ACB092_09G100300 [Castanea dentata]